MSLARTPSATRRTSSEHDVWLTIPNGITILRLFAIFPFIFFATHGSDRAALFWFVAAGLTDSLDGVLARRLGQASKIGRLLDPIVDKLFTGIAYLTLSTFRPAASHIPTALMVAVILRDVLILFGSLLVYSKRRNSGFQPSVFGKLNTFLEISAVVCFLASSEVPVVGATLPVLYAVVFVSLLVSAADYFRTGLRMIRPVAEETHVK